MAPPLELGARVGFGAMMATAPGAAPGRRGGEESIIGPMIVNLRKSWLWAAAVALTMGAAMPAFADYETGLRAYELGDYEGALEEIQPLAKRGDPGSQFLLGVMYAEGRGVPWDEVKALAWLACAGVGRSKFFRQKSDQWRARLMKTADAEVLAKANAETRKCLTTQRRDRRVVELGKGGEYYRASLLTRLFFFVGDSLVLGILVVAAQAEWAWLEALVFALLDIFGNVLLGLISLVWWFFAFRVASITAAALMRKTALHAFLDISRGPAASAADERPDDDRPSP
ncbi:MAG: sel1 repeat family protein [Proteobacteria bacterium]|nr:sel1 repeat family protein [Pseudomonadota bacterium]